MLKLSHDFLVIDTLDFWLYSRSQYLWGWCKERLLKREKKSVHMWAEMQPHTHKHTQRHARKVSRVQMGVEWINTKTVGLVDISAEWVYLPLSVLCLSFFLFCSLFLFFSLCLFCAASFFLPFFLLSFLPFLCFFPPFLSCLHANTHTVMNTSKSKARSSYGLVLRASNVMRVKNRLTENNIEIICGNRTSPESAEAESVWLLWARRFWHGFSLKEIILLGHSGLTQVAAFELPGVMTNSLVVIQGSEHSTININEIAESDFGRCGHYSDATGLHNHHIKLDSRFFSLDRYLQLWVITYWQTTGQFDQCFTLSHKITSHTKFKKCFNLKKQADPFIFLFLGCWYLYARFLTELQYYFATDWNV